jgi:hypothetical protein
VGFPEGFLISQLEINFMLIVVDLFISIIVITSSLPLLYISSSSPPFLTSSFSRSPFPPFQPSSSSSLFLHLLPVLFFILFPSLCVCIFLLSSLPVFLFPSLCLLFFHLAVFLFSFYHSELHSGTCLVSEIHTV